MYLYVTSGERWPTLLVMTNHLSAILMGVVRQAVNRSAAASSGFMGSSWSLPHAASWMQFLRREEKLKYLIEYLICVLIEYL